MVRDTYEFSDSTGRQRHPRISVPVTICHRSSLVETSWMINEYDEGSGSYGDRERCGKSV